MEDIAELIRRYGLDEDIEHIIIPLPPDSRGQRRCFILKRRFLRIISPDGHFGDFPLSEIIEAIVEYPEMALSESIKFVHKDPEIQLDEVSDTELHGVDKNNE